jgi:TP901 family phage tail tape measure protein
MAFNINAQVILSGPKNLKQVTKKIGSEFRKASNVKLNVAGGQQQFTNISKRIKGVSSSINKLNANLRSTSKSIAALNSSFSRGATSVNNIAKAQSKLQASAAAANTPLKQQAGLLKNVGSRFASVAKQAVAFGLISRPIYDLQRAFVTATKDAVKFEKEIVKISQVTGQTVGQLDSLKSTINSLASSLGANANELAETARIIAQTGKTAQETELILKALARSTLAPTFGKLTDTTEGLVAALAQFNLEAKDSEAILGALNRVSKNFAVEAEDLVSVIRRTGGVFAQAAGDSRNTIGALQELISIFTAVRSTTRESADTIAAGLRTIFSRIQRKSTIDFLKNFGVELTNVKGEFIGLFPAFDELSNKLSNLIATGDALTLSQIAEELGGIRQIGKLLPAIAQFQKARDALGQAQKGALEGLSGDVTKGLDTIDNRIKRVKESFSALIRDVFDTPAFQTFSKSILSVSENLIKFGGSFIKFIEPLLPLITTLGAIKISRSLTSFIGSGVIGSFFGSITGTATASNTALTSAAAQQTSKATSSTVSLLTSQNQILSSSNNLLTQISRQFSNLIQINNAGFNALIQTSRTSTVVTGFGRRASGGAIPKFKDGGRVYGPSHAAGGVIAELEGGEYVVPKKYANGTPQDGVEGLGRTRGITKPFSLKASRLRNKSVQSGQRIVGNRSRVPQAQFGRGNYINTFDTIKGSFIQNTINSPDLLAKDKATATKFEEQVKSVFGGTLTTDQAPFDIIGTNPITEVKNTKGKVRDSKLLDKFFRYSLQSPRTARKFRNNKNRSDTINLGTGVFRVVYNAAKLMLGGLVQSLATGDIVRANSVGAAILDPDNPPDGNAKISVKDVEKQIGFKSGTKPGFSGVGSVFKGKSYNIVREGLNEKTSQVFNQALAEGLIEGIDFAAAKVAQDLGFPAKKIDQNSKTKFIRSQRAPIRGDLFEAVALSQSNQGVFDSTFDPSRPFDFPDGIKGRFADNFSRLPSQFIDAKSSEEAATITNLRGKILREVAQDVIRQDPSILQKARGGSGSKSRSSKSPRGFGAVTLNTGGEVPVRISNGEMVVSDPKEVAANRGALQRINKLSTGGFASGYIAKGPGTGKSDSIYTTLPQGAFVVNAASTKKYLGLRRGGSVGSPQRLVDGGTPRLADPRGGNVDKLLNEEKNARKKNNDALKNNTKQLNKAKLDINNLVGAVFALQFAIGDIGRLFSEGEKTSGQLFSTLLSLTTTFALLGSTVPWKAVGSGLAKIPGAVKNIPQTFKLAQNSVKGLSKALVDSSTKGAKFGQALTGYGKIFIESGAKLSKAGNTVAGGIRSTIGKGLQGIGSKGAQLIGPRAAGLIGTAIGSQAFAALSAGTFYIPIGNAIGKVVGNKIDSLVFGQREEIAGFKGREGQGDAGAALSGALREGFQGAGLGAGIGATIGSLIAPVIGTAIGAAIGAGAGAIVGTITGAINGPLEQAAFQSAKNYLKAQDEVVKSIEALTKGFSLAKFDKFLDDFLASGEAAADAVSTFKDKFENEIDLFGTLVKSLVAPLTLSAVVITKFTNAISKILSGLAVGGLGDISGGFVSDVSFSPDAIFEAFNDSLTEIGIAFAGISGLGLPLVSIFSGLEAVGKNLQQRGISFDETFNRAFELLDKGFEKLGLFEPSVLGLTKTIDNAVKSFAAQFEGVFDVDLGPAGKTVADSFNLITENFGKFLESATFGLLGDFTDSSAKASSIDKAFKSFETIFDPKKAEAARRALSQGLAKLVEIGEIDVADLGLDANIIEGVDFKRLTQIRDGLEAQLDELDPAEFEGTAREFRAKQQALQQQLDFANEGLEQLDLGRNIIQGIDARIEAIGDATDPEVQRLKKILQGYNQVFGNQLTQSQKLLQEQGDDQTNFLGFGGGAQKDAAKGLRQLNFEIQQGETSLADLTDEQIEAQARAKTNSAEARQLFIQQAKAARDAALADAEAAVQQGQLNALLRQSNSELNKFVRILSESGDRLNKANAEAAVAFENAANAAKIFEGEVAFDRTVNPFEFGASGAADRQSSITALGNRLNAAGVTSVGAQGNFVEAPRAIETDNITNFLNVIDNAGEIAERTFNELQAANVDGGQISSKDVSNAFISNIEDELGGIRLGQPLRDSIISKIEAEYNREGGGELGIDDFKRRVEEAGGIVEFLGPRFQEVFDAAGRLKAAEDLLIQNAQTYAQSLVDAEKNRIEAEFKIIDKLNQVRDFIVDPESDTAKRRNRFGADLDSANATLGSQLGELGFGPNVTGAELQAEIAAGQANAEGSQALFDAGLISAQEFAKAQANATTQVTNANQALNLLASDTTRLAAIQKEAGKLIQRRDEARGLADTFVTAQLTGDIAAQSRFEESRRVASAAFSPLGPEFGNREAQERAFLRAQEDPQFAAIFAAQARSQGFEGETSQDVLDAVRVRNLREEASRAAAGGDTSRAAFLNQLADDIEAPGLEDLQKEANRIGNEQVGLLRIIAANQIGVDQEQITAQLEALNAQQQVVADETQTLNDVLEDATTPATPQQPLSVGGAAGAGAGGAGAGGAGAGGAGAGGAGAGGAGAGGAGGAGAGTLQPGGGGGLIGRITSNASQGLGLLADAIFGQPTTQGQPVTQANLPVFSPGTIGQQQIPQSATQQIPLGANQTVGSSVIDQALERQEELINQQAEQLTNFQVAFGENVSNINNAASSIATAASVIPNQLNVNLPALEVANTDAIGESVAVGTAARLNPLLQNALNANQQNAPAQGSIDG